jgi:S1-C subfamily serine protease
MGGRHSVMATFLASLAFLTYLYGIITVNADAWPTQNVLAAITRIDVQFGDKTGTCTAFSVDQARGRFITAGHCATGAVTLGGITFAEIDRDADADLVLLQTNRGSLPALKLGSAPRTGDATIAVGYPLKSPRPMVLPSMYQGQFDAWDDGHDFAIFSGNSMPGMSGGPIVNLRGDVVSVVLGGGNPSQAFQNVGFGAPYQSLRRLLLKWRED